MNGIKRMGILYPSSGVSELEIQKILPEGVTLHVTRIPMGMPTYEAELHMVDYAEEASRLLADAKVDIIAFSSTVGSLIKGKGFDQEIINRIEKATGTKATTAATAVVAGLRALKVKKLVLLSPYAKTLHLGEKAFLEAEGFVVLKDRTLELSDCFEQYGTDPTLWYRIARELDHSDSEGCLVSCGGIRVVNIINQLETDLMKPVVTTNQALVWHCLRNIGFPDPLRGFGRLLELPLR